MKSPSSDLEKEKDINAIIGEKIHHESFLNLSNLARSITDYKIDEEEEEFQEGMIIEGSEE